MKQPSSTPRILFVNYYMDSAEIALVNALHEQGIFVRAVTGPHVKPALSESIFIKSRPHRSKLSLLAAWQVRKLTQALNINIVHSTSSKSMAISLLGTWGLDIKHVGYRGTIAKIRKSDPTFHMTLLNPRMSRVICVSRSIYEHLSNFRRPQDLLLNYKGFDPAWVKNPDPAKILPKHNSESIALLCVANTKSRPSKGMDFLIPALHSLNLPNVEFFLVGSFDEGLAQSVQGNPRIHFLGELDDAWHYINKADIFILPSIRDGLPRSIKEAMALSIPVIATDVPGPNEMVRHMETGVLIQPGSIEELKGALELLSNNRTLRQAMGQAGRQRLESDFSVDTWISKTVRLYQEISPVQRKYHAQL